MIRARRWGSDLAKASEQFRQSDVTIWGIVALVLGGIAVLGANVSALVPPAMLAGLHTTRLEGASLEQLRQQVAQLRQETISLKRENGVLTARFALDQQQGNEITRRVGALEVSLPRLLEALPDNAQIDRGNLTAAIGDDSALTYETPGGSVKIRQQPMAEAQATPPDAQPLPPALTQMAALPAPDAAAYGVALGAVIPPGQALQGWRDLNMKLGPLLFGLTPLLADAAGSSDKRIVVGPITQLSEATALCAQLERISIACLPTEFTGTPLAY